MRTFYIFKISNEFVTLTRYNPYNLYKTMEQIINVTTDEVDMCFNMYKQISKPINKNSLNNYIFNKYKEDDHYTKYTNKHMINNFYNDEQTKLTINNSYILLESTKDNPIFFNILSKVKNLFVCDFENNDYFWLEQIYLLKS